MAPFGGPLSFGHISFPNVCHATIFNTKTIQFTVRTTARRTKKPTRSDQLSEKDIRSVFFCHNSRETVTTMMLSKQAVAALLLTTLSCAPVGAAFWNRETQEVEEKEERMGVDESWPMHYSEWNPLTPERKRDYEDVYARMQRSLW